MAGSPTERQRHKGKYLGEKSAIKPRFRGQDVGSRRCISVKFKVLRETELLSGIFSTRTRTKMTRIGKVSERTMKTRTMKTKMTRTVKVSGRTIKTRARPKKTDTTRTVKVI